MYGLTVVLSAIFMIGSAIWYSILIVRDKIDPPPATWAIVAWSITLSMAMYMDNPDWSITGNIGLSAAVVDIWLITIVLFGKLVWQKRLAMSFNTFQKWTMIASLVVVAFWVVTDNELTAYLLVQLSMLIGYLPTIQRLKTVDHNTESFTIWVGALLSSVVAAYPAFVMSDVFAFIYVVRTVPSTAYIIWLIARLELKDRAIRSVFV